MTKSNFLPLIAVDIGNSRTKFGLFGDLQGDPLPVPSTTLGLSGSADELPRLNDWLAQLPAAPAAWWIASVNRPACTRLIDWLRQHRPGDPIRMLASFDLPLQVVVERPDMVGIDRLAGAAAANRLRRSATACAVVDLGTAITVDLLSPDGSFLGGAILPGIGMAARALHEFTDLLPLLDMETLSHSPDPIGVSTVDAMQSGLYWGAVGAARELISRFRQTLGHQPQVLLTGGAAATVAPLIEPGAVYVPHLVLSGIALSSANSAHAGQ